MERLSALSRARLLLAAAILTAAAALWLIGRPFVFPLDDAYITLHNAEALWAGWDDNYQTSPLTGATSLVHLAMVAVATRVLPGVAGGFLVATLGVLAYGLALLQLVSRAAVSWPMRAALVFVGLAASDIPFHLFNGLETTWAMAAVAAAILLATSERPSRWLAVLCGLMPFLRPELAALSGPLMLIQAWRRGPDLRATLLDWAAFAAAAAPWLAWSWFAIGQPMPGTLGAKIAFFAEATKPFPAKAATAFIFLAVGLGPLGLGLFYIRGDRVGLALLTFLAAFTLAFILVLPSSLAHNLARYTYVLTPLAIYGYLAVAEHGARLSKVIIVALAAFAVATLPRSLSSVRGGQLAVHDAEAAAAWVAANVPAGTPILVHDAGVVAFRSALHLVDLVGLKTPASVAAHQRWTLPSRRREIGKALNDIAGRSGVGYFIDRRDDPFWGGLATALAAEGWTLTPMYGADRVYAVYRLTPPGAPSPKTSSSEQQDASQNVWKTPGP